MPISQDDLALEIETPKTKVVETQPIPIERSSSRAGRLSEESIRTKLCEGLVLGSPPRQIEPDVRIDHGEHGHEGVTDRAELIERLKRGESPTWIPNRHLETIFHQNRTIPQSRSPRTSSSPGNLLPSADITPEKAASQRDTAHDGEGRLSGGLEIERPRSALHTGDFTFEGSECRHKSRREDEDSTAEINEHFIRPESWLATSPPRAFSPFRFDRRLTAYEGNSEDMRPGYEGYRASPSCPSSLSSELSSSFGYRAAPTSPLVQSEVNEDVDFSLPLTGATIPAAASTNARRHTFASVTSSPSASASPSTISGNYRSRMDRREASIPYRAHQPRRSTSSIGVNCTPPRTPSLLRSRRPSYSSDSSPLQHASMVGSYEESILRGRMSTTPSKPLDFLAQIGVLGLGKCKSSLRCPSHVSVPFHAVFYSYNHTLLGRSRSDEGPSPYVGQIDLENGLSNLEDDQRVRRKQQSRYAERLGALDDVEMKGVGNGSDHDHRKMTRAKKRSASPKTPPGGSYRIPAKGQIQMIIKNQNKTAVKLFLVPYDLTGMEPGTKTFIRQRSYSAGPVIESIADMPADAPLPANPPVLRYLVHLHICSPSRGRFYLYKNIRVVFANRVPDGKEKLRNETTFPEPRFAPYKPIRVMHPPVGSGALGPAAVLTAEKAFRRRSSGHSFGEVVNGFHDNCGTTDPNMPSMQPPFSLGHLLNGGGNGPPNRRVSLDADTLPMDLQPWRIPSRARRGSDLSDTTDTNTTMAARDFGNGVMLSSPLSEKSARDGPEPIAIPGFERYEKLRRDDFEGRGSPGAGAEGLLSQRLRGLGVERKKEEPADEEHQEIF